MFAYEFFSDKNSISREFGSPKNHPPTYVVSDWRKKQILYLSTIYETPELNKIQWRFQINTWL